MLKEADFFGEEPLHLIYIAKKLREAKALETVLTERSIDYLVEPDHYVGGIIFRGNRIGAFFYVRGDDLDRSRAAMKEHSYEPYEVGDATDQRSDQG